jgi:hypothetical protein
MGFSMEGFSQQDMFLFEGKGKLMQHIKLHTLDDVDQARVVELLRLVAEKVDDCQPF